MYLYLFDISEHEWQDTAGMGNVDNAKEDSETMTLQSDASTFPFLILAFGIIFFLVLGISISYAKSRDLFNPQEKSRKNTRRSKEIIDYSINNNLLIQLISGDEEESELVKTFQLTSITEDFLHRIDLLGWEDERQKARFIREMLALTPEERDDIIDYMLEKSRKEN